MLIRLQRRARARLRVLSLFIFFSLVFPYGIHAQMIIGEVNWAGSSRSIADEWIELWNTSSSTQSLTGWSLSGASREPFVFGSGQDIPAHQTFLISNYDETNIKSSLDVYPSLVSTDVSLANDRLHLVLRDPQGNIVDEVLDGRPPAGSAQPFASMIRSGANSDSATSTNWISATSKMHLDAGVEDFGTPGICDRCVDITDNIAETPSPITVSSTVIEFMPSTTTSAAEFMATSTIDLSSLEATTTESLVQEFSSSTVFGVETSSTSTYQSTSSTIVQIEESVINATSSHTSSTSLETMNTASSTTNNTACEWHLQTIFPAPNDGPEWVEVNGCDDPALLVGWSIEDANGLILQVTSTLPLSPEGYVRLNLPGQHLRNTGDTVILRGPEEGMSEIVSYPSLQHDEHYTHQEDGGWLIPERLPVSTSVVISPPSYTSPIPTTSSTPLTTSSAASSKQTTNSSASSTKMVVKQTAVSAAIVKQKQAVVTVFSQSYEDYLSSKTKATPKKSSASSTKTIVKKMTSSKKSSSTMSASSSSLAPHVKLRGVVGSPPNLVGASRFVLLNEKGQGLLIYGNKKQPSPALGESIEVTGTLITNDNGAHLEIRAQDRWQASSKIFSPPLPTIVDLEDSEPEYNWNLVELVGQVQDGKSGSIKITVDDQDIQIVVHRSLNYRAERLKKGDTVRVLGVINLRSDIPKLYPRTQADIVLIAPVTMLAASSTSSTAKQIPPWAPVGAAGTSIATAYGLRRLRERQTQKRLAERLSAAVQKLSL